MKLTSSRYLFLLVALVLPFTAEANTGTILMMAKVMHITYGNVVIALLEGLLLWKLSKYPFWKCFGLMLLANFFSTIIGVMLFEEIELTLPLGWNNVRGLFWLLVFLAYLLTLASEFPFIWFAFRGTPLRFKRTIRASFIIQSVSYLLLIGWYGLATPPPVKVVDPSTMVLPKEVTLYFIATADGDVYSGPLHERKWKRIFDLNEEWNTDLFSRKSPHMSRSWDLMVSTNRWQEESSKHLASIVVEERFATGDMPARKSYGIIPALGGTNTSWEIWHRIGRLRGYNKKISRGFWFSMETPFCSWDISDAILLPGDKILLRLYIRKVRAQGHICIYDPDTDQLAVIARGRSPLAVLKKENSVDQPKPKE
jgi:hypothetical protein